MIEPKEIALPIRNVYQRHIELHIMKFSVLALIPAASAFVVKSPAIRPPTRMMASETEAIQAAMEASKNFGASSPEARVAWDAVEEITSSDDR